MKKNNAMLKNVCAKILALISLFSLAFSVRAQESGTLKIISYNIWNGFEKQQDRKDKFSDWIRKEQPDIVALQELVDFKQTDLVQLAKTYGHPHTVLLKEKGYPVGISSRYPITLIKAQVDSFWHGMLHVKIKNLDLIVTHLSPFSWKYRLGEARQIVEYIKTNRLDNCIIMGDLNAYSPLDASWLEPKSALKANLRKWDQEHPQYGNMNGSRFDYRVLSTFMAAGFDDCIGRAVFPESKRASFPTATLYNWKWGDARLPAVSERLDYILLSEVLAPHVQQVEAHNGAALEGISDHYPVSVVIDQLEK
ncbi:endonuclease/exonuclease/phosphatase family protein [Sphingobacterium sp. NGMCC 1.201703]|uniref:endonuclease/exonuclease/phosphatase family protein n=1 Tax=Sphingobacterium sp. NGMCC 1.201703 TaxID=3388657 RepID=UPI0039FC4CD5